MNDWIDISVPIAGGMVHWPGDPEIEVKRIAEMEQGADCNITHLSMTAHTGTHMDAPAHFIKDGAGMESMPLEATIGPARVIEINDTECIREKHLTGLNLMAGERILFKTRNSSRCWIQDSFAEDFVYVSAEAARYLATTRVQTVGIDYLSVGGFLKDNRETHVALLEAGIWILEGLNLQHVDPGIYDLVCLPIKVTGADGAPARAVLRRNLGTLSFEHR